MDMDMDMDDSGPPSVFVVLLRPDTRSPHCCSILQFQSKVNNKQSIENKKHDESSAQQKFVVDIKQVAHFAHPKVPARWLFSPLSNEELFMVPYISNEAYADLPSLNGIVFNLRTKTLRTTLPPFTIKNRIMGCAVNLGGSLYFMPHPCDQSMSPDPDMSPDNRLERFVSASNELVTLQPFPLPFNSIIQATAVWLDTILFNMLGCELWAYNVTQGRWYPVTVQDGDKLCYSIEGQAVVLGNTIYALKSNLRNSILALSIQTKQINGENTYTCSLLCEIAVPAMKRISSMYRSATRETRNLVHLGKDDFCLVQCCECVFAYQPILLTYMTLKGNNSMIVTHDSLGRLPTRNEGQCHVALCFSLPEFETPPTIRQAQKFFDINPFPEGFDRECYLRKMGIRSGKVQEYVSPQTNIFDGQDLSSLDPAVRELLSLYPAMKAELSRNTAVKAYLESGRRNPSKRLKTAGEGIPHRSSDIEQGGGSKTRDPSSSPEIHMQEKSSASKGSLTTVPEGGLIFNGRPLRSYLLPEKMIIVHSLMHQYMASDSLSRAKKKEKKKKK